MSRQAVYLHFGSRAGLLVALVRNMDEEAGIREKLVDSLRIEDPSESFTRFVGEWLRYAITIQPVASALFAARRGDAAAAEAWDDRAGDLRAGFRAATSRLGDAGLLRTGLSARSAAGIVWSFCSVPVVEQLTADLGWPEDRVVRETTRAALGAVITPGHEPGA